MKGFAIDAILFDGDGVTILPGPMFSEYYAAQHHLTPELMAPFFTGPFQAAMEGKADLREIVLPHLAQWGWAGSVDDFLGEWFRYENRPNSEMLALVDQLRASGIQCALATGQERHRGEYIRSTMHFDDHFDQLFISGKLGVRKPSPDFWDACMSGLGLSDPGRVLMIDDSQRAIDGAAAYGLKTHLFTNIEPLRELLTSYGILAKEQRGVE